MALASSSRVVLRISQQALSSSLSRALPILTLPHTVLRPGGRQRGEPSPSQSARLLFHARSIRQNVTSEQRSVPSPAPAVPNESHAPPDLTRITRRPSSPEEPKVLEGGDPKVLLTETGAARLDAVAEREGKDGIALRVEVMPGGCHGYQYAMNVVDEGAEEDDFCFTSITYPRASLLIDSVSLRLLKGSTIDYATELIGSQFVIRDNPQAKGAGCGCGVSWEPNVDI
ncbi:hypothetical protein IE81DRAFT_326112 [Ceraceosorus guamensis]|uniref:Core domain-containing protein n=1 Tax=Ceraceosorus guamensis TaxID=1522189 RepID=A0A316VR74_9BASI|nr:hypothetical protein IE81DRAFT_326112 [Ceraceosorus guamensis]PWN39850.1 hypothetical protein IE81DRAFT_326112 [Ceraceosorus guamensis]